MYKVAFYIDCMQMGGANRVMANLVDYFYEIGWQVILINDIPPQKDIPEYEIKKDVKRIYLDCNKGGKITRNIKRIFTIRGYIKEEKPDVVVSFMGPPNERMLVSTLGLKVKKVVSVRNDPYREYGKGIRKIVANILFGFSDGCVFQTEEAALYFSKRVRTKSQIIYNPVNKKFFNYRWKKEKNEIAVVGRLQAQKNPLLAVEAFSRVCKKFPDYSLVFYGDDELKNSIIERSKILNIEDKVTIYGKTSVIEEKLAASALFLLSSDYEGMPNALMEAMAVGIPIVSTDCPCGGPRTLIQNKKQGILVPIQDELEMSYAIEQILSNNDLQNEMSKAEKERALDFYPERIFLQWKEYLIGVILGKEKNDKSIY